MNALAQIPDDQATALFDAVMRGDLVSFIGKVHGTVSPGTRFAPSWHINAIAHVLEQVANAKLRRVVITLPPRSMKSTAVTVGFTAHLLGHDPEMRIITASYSDGLSAKFSRDTRRVMQSEWYRRAFPRAVLSRVADQELALAAGGSRLATSVGGTLTGRGADVIVIDDPHKAEEANSSAALTKVRDWYDGTLLSRLDDRGQGRIVLVMQRLHVDDLAGHLLAQEGWHHLNLPAIAEIEETIPLGGGRHYTRRVDEVLQPHRDTVQDLDALRRQMGTALFSAQFQQSPIPPGGNLVDWKWLPTFKLPLAQDPEDRFLLSWDTAFTDGELSDYSVGLTFVVRGDLLFLIDVFRERLRYPDLKRAIWDQCRRRHNPICLVEEASVGKALIQDLRAKGLKVTGFKPGGDKVSRLSQESGQLEEGRLLVPTDAPWLADFRDELLAFPRGRHDDQVDALSQALGWIRERKRRTVTWGGLRGAH